MHRLIACSAFVFLLVAPAASAKDAKDLFNGKDLTGWEGDKRIWSVEDGTIVGRTKPEVDLKHNTFLVWKGGDVADFKLTLEYKLEGGNSGVQYRSKLVEPAEFIVGGYQADMDGDNKYTGILYEERGRGIVTNRGERVSISADGKKEASQANDSAELAKSIHKNDWNTYVIEARGGRLKHTINGKLMSDTTDRDREHKAKSGILALQVHAGLPAPMTVRFRNIKFQELEPRTSKKADSSNGATKSKKKS